MSRVLRRSCVCNSLAHCCAPQRCWLVHQAFNDSCRLLHCCRPATASGTTRRRRGATPLVSAAAAAAAAAAASAALAAEWQLRVRFFSYPAVFLLPPLCSGTRAELLTQASRQAMTDLVHEIFAGLEAIPEPQLSPYASLAHGTPRLQASATTLIKTLRARCMVSCKTRAPGAWLVHGCLTRRTAAADKACTAYLNPMHDTALAKSRSGRCGVPKSLCCLPCRCLQVTSRFQ